MACDGRKFVAMEVALALCVIMASMAVCWGSPVANVDVASTTANRTSSPTTMEPDVNNQSSTIVFTTFMPLVTDPSENGTSNGTAAVDEGFLHAFVASLSMTLVSELGDKTFFIAAIMATTHPRLSVFGGAMSALLIMTALSTGIGFAGTFIKKVYTFYISAALFALFGLKMFWDAYRMKPEEAQEELEEVQSQLKHREEELERVNPESSPVPNYQAGDLPGVITPAKKAVDGNLAEAACPVKKKAKRLAAFKLFVRVFVQAFTMTFLAEWGDRSQISTIMLAATEDVWGVGIGGTTGHAICTGLAVIGGRLIASRISVRTVTIIGGILFILFSISSFILGPNRTLF